MTAALDTASLRIDGEMTIYRATELKAALLAALDGRGALALDLDGVTELDSAGLQLLLLAKNTLGERGGQLRLTRFSEAVGATLALLNLSGHFAAPAADGVAHGS